MRIVSLALAFHSSSFADSRVAASLLCFAPVLVLLMFRPCFVLLLIFMAVGGESSGHGVREASHKQQIGFIPTKATTEK